MATVPKYTMVKLENGELWQAAQDGNRLVLVSQLAPPSLPKIRIPMSGGGVAEKPEPPEAPPEPLELERVKQPISDSVFRARLSSIMTDNKFDRKLKNRTRGRLDMTHLPKAKTGSQSVFTQKQARKGKQYNVVLVVDESGSMSAGHLVTLNGKEVERTRAEMAGEAAAFLGVHLPGLVDLAILGFNHTIEVHKTFDQPSPVDLAKTVVERSDSQMRGCNHDYQALEEAYKLFKGRPGTNLVIFLSDGEPAQCPDEVDSDEYRAYLAGGETGRGKNDKLVIRQMVRSHTEAQTFGIGLFVPSDQVPVNFTIKNLEELKPQILDTLNKHIKRG